MKKTILTPLSVLAGICAVLILMAGTDFFNPIITFIHTNTISVYSTGMCFAFTILGFAACYFSLNILCTYFVPRIETDQKSAQPLGKSR